MPGRSRLAILGATGGTGRLLVEQALESGAQVTAVVRDRTALPVVHSRLEVVVADVFDAQSLAPALRGRDAVLSALGPRQRAKDLTVCSRATSSLLRAMAAGGPERVLVISAAPVSADDPGDSGLQRVAMPLVHALFRRRYDDLAAMEALLRESATTWTVLRPPLLTNGPRRGRARITAGRNGGAWRISRADLADAMLRSVDDASTFRTVAGVA